MVNGRFVAGGVAAPEWFHSSVDLSCVARSSGRDAERYFRWSYGVPLGMGTRCAH